MVVKVAMIGRKFGRLTVISEAPCHLDPSRRKRRAFTCKCDCGAQLVARGEDLRSGNTQSCGCRQVESVIKKNWKHGESQRGKRTREHILWQGMIDRCYRPDVVGPVTWKNYGGRGIKVCDRWRFGENDKSGFECFLEDVGRRPSPKMSLDRYPDNDGDYGPHNFRWATRFQQNTNQRQKTPRLKSLGVQVLP